MFTAEVESSTVASQHLNLSQSQIKQGLPYQTFESLLSSLQLSTKRLAGAIGISPHTLRRRRKDGRFSFVESDRLARFINLYQHSASALESEAAAASWLARDNQRFDGLAPLEYASTEPGYQELLMIIDSIADDSFG